MTGQEYLRQRLAAYYNTQAQLYQARVEEYKSLLPGQTDKWWQDHRARAKANEKAIQALEDMGIKAIAEARKQKQAQLLRQRGDVKDLATLENDQEKFNARVANQRAADERAAARRGSGGSSAREVEGNIIKAVTGIREVARDLGTHTKYNELGQKEGEEYKPGTIDPRQLVDAVVADATKGFEDLSPTEASDAARSLSMKLQGAIQDIAKDLDPNLALEAVEGDEIESKLTGKERWVHRAMSQAGSRVAEIRGVGEEPVGPIDYASGVDLGSMGDDTAETPSGGGSGRPGYNFVDLKAPDYSAIDAQIDELYAPAAADDPAVVRAAELYATLRDGDVTPEDATEMIRNLSPAERAAFMSRAADALEEKSALELEQEQAEWARGITRRDVEDYTRYENIRSAGGKKFINATKAVRMLDEIYGDDAESKRQAIRQYADNVGLSERALNKVLERIDRPTDRLVRRIDRDLDRNFPLDGAAPTAAPTQTRSTPSEVEAFNRLYGSPERKMTGYDTAEKMATTAGIELNEEVSDIDTEFMKQKLGERAQDADMAEQVNFAPVEATPEMNVDLAFVNNLDSNRVASDVAARKGMSNGLMVGQVMSEYMREQLAGQKVSGKDYAQAVDNAFYEVASNTGLSEDYIKQIQDNSESLQKLFKLHKGNGTTPSIEQIAAVVGPEVADDAIFAQAANAYGTLAVSRGDYS